MPPPGRSGQRAGDTVPPLRKLRISGRGRHAGGVAQKPRCRETALEPGGDGTGAAGEGTAGQGITRTSGDQGVRAKKRWGGGGRPKER